MHDETTMLQLKGVSLMYITWTYFGTVGVDLQLQAFAKLTLLVEMTYLNLATLFSTKFYSQNKDD